MIYLSVPLLSSLCVAVWAGTVIWQMSQPGGVGSQPELKTLYRLPPFSLTDQAGNEVTRETLDGDVWVADFIFTRCPGPCPVLTRRMAELQRAVASDPALQGVKLVSISVDPEHDTPEVLRGYGEKYGADRDRWRFLTGEREAVGRLIRDGFRLGVTLVGDVAAEGNVIEEPTHSDRWVLIDRDGWVRGYYSGMSDAGHTADDVPGRAALLEDLRRVVEE